MEHLVCEYVEVVKTEVLESDLASVYGQTSKRSRHSPAQRRRGEVHGVGNGETWREWRPENSFVDPTSVIYMLK